MRGREGLVGGEQLAFSQLSSTFSLSSRRTNAQLCKVGLGRFANQPLRASLFSHNFVGTFSRCSRVENWKMGNREPYRRGNRSPVSGSAVLQCLTSLHQRNFFTTSTTLDDHAEVLHLLVSLLSSFGSSYYESSNCVR